MRELKFRAWDGERMREPITLKEGFHHADEGIRQETVMQYTGLKDKNGVEIYEGDILKAYNSSFESESVGQVKFKNGTFTIGRYWKDGVHDWYSMEQYISPDLEVIGNIYENPELLNK